MFEEEGIKSFKKDPGSKAGAKATYGRAVPQFVWSSMEVDDLIHYRDEITAALRECMPMSIKDVSIEEELLLQYQSLRSLQSYVLQNDEVPPNQQAQVANTVGSILAKLADMQSDIYTSERYKQIENLLIRQLSKLPEAAAAAFLDDYAKVLATV